MDQIIRKLLSVEIGQQKKKCQDMASQVYDRPTI